jgi:hypothetical protein
MPREAARASPRRGEAHRVGGTQALPVDHRGRRLPTGSERDSLRLDRSAGGGLRGVCRRGAGAEPCLYPKTVCTDGWEATQNAWQPLFPGTCLILCFLHAVLKIGERCVRNLPLGTSLVDKAWPVYEAVTRAQFSQRLRRFRGWGLKHKSLGPLRNAVLKLCTKGPRFCVRLQPPGRPPHF